MVKYLFWGMMDTCEDVHIVSTFKEDVAKKQELNRLYKLRHITQTIDGSEIKNESTV